MKAIISLIFILLINLSYAQYNEWTWLHGTNASGSCVFGTVTVPAAGNTPGGRYAPNSWSDSIGNLWLFGGAVFDETPNTMWKYDPSIDQWAWMSGDHTKGDNIPSVFGTQGVPSAATDPGGGLTYGMAEWNSKDGFFWMFGGIGGVSYTSNNLWKYDPGTLQWTWMKGDGTTGAGVYGVQGVPDPANLPPGRCETDATWVDAAGNLWIFGGYNDGSAIFNDLWKYDISTNEWTWMNGNNYSGGAGVFGTYQTYGAANTPPASGENYTSWVDSSGKFWLFGGGANYNYLWKYDPDPLSPTYNQWAWMNGSQARYPTPVFGAQCVEDINNQPTSQLELRARWTDDCGNLYMFGGADNNSVNNYDCYNTIWRYNTSTNMWAFLRGDNIPKSLGNFGTQGVSSPSNLPSGIWASVAWRTKDGIWVYGGENNVSTKDNMWFYKPDKPNVAYTPSVTSGFGPLTVNFTDNSTPNCTAIKKWFWDFGDGTTSASQNPSHIYNSTGTFQAKLIVTNCLAMKDSSTQTITVFSGLPIELLDFTATKNDASVELDWNTASETNNDYFTIDRSHDKNIFEKLLDVKGAGTSSVRHSYKAIDEKPLSGMSYYRLKQTDIDGKYTYSQIVPVNFESESFDFKIVPNPASGNNITMQLSGLQDKNPVLVVITDVLGRIYYSKVVMNDLNGSTQIVLQSSEPLAEGVYIITASENNRLISKRLVISK